MRTSRLSLAASAAILLAALPVHANENLALDRVVAPTAPAGSALPWVNVRIFDLEFLAGGPFASLAPTVEMQVSTVQTPFDDPNTGDASCCVMPGRGNLGAGENLRALFMTVNPALFTVPGAELLVEWAGGAPGFPDAGQAPASVVLSPNPAVDPFDLTIRWDPAVAVTHSKFLLTYKVGGVTTDIDAADFMMANPTGYSAMALVEYANGSTGLVGAVPEPTTWATLGLGLAAIVLMRARRRTRA